MTPPAPALEERIAVLETLVNAILPNLATKSEIAEVKTEIARLEGKIDAVNERLEGKIDTMNERIDAMGNSLLIKFVGVTIPIVAIAVAIAVAAVKYL